MDEKGEQSEHEISRLEAEFEFYSDRAAHHGGLAQIASWISVGSTLLAVLFTVWQRLTEKKPVQFPDFSWLLRFDPVPFLVQYKFESVALFGALGVVSYVIAHRRVVFRQSSIGGIFFAFLAGSTIPAGFVFILVPFFPNHLDVIKEFREFLFVSGIALVIVSFVGLRAVLKPTSAED